ncbi:MAG: hypothetical protein WBD02_09775 [Acidimicrobiia bacterium]
MTILVLGVLALLWAITLAPPAWRALKERGGLGSVTLPRIGGLGRHRDSFEPLAPITGPVPVITIARDGSIASGPAAGPGLSAAQRRQRGVLLLSGIAVVTFLLALVASSMVFWLIHALADIALALFVVKMRQFGAMQGMQLGTLAKLERSPSALAGVSYLPQRHIVEPGFRRSSSF